MEINTKVSLFLNNILKINVKKVRIIHALSSSTQFLGFDIRLSNQHSKKNKWNKRCPKLAFSLFVSMKKLKNRLKKWNILTLNNKPKACGTLFQYTDRNIIEFFKNKSLYWLKYYYPALNFFKIKKLINYHLRWSLIHTLAGKHRVKIYKIIQKYGKTPKIKVYNNKKIQTTHQFLTPNQINSNSEKTFNPKL